MASIRSFAFAIAMSAAAAFCGTGSTAAQAAGQATAGGATLPATTAPAAGHARAADASGQPAPDGQSTIAHGRPPLQLDAGELDERVMAPPEGDGRTPADGNRLDQWTVHVAHPANDTDYSFNNRSHGSVLFSKPGLPNGLDWDGYSHDEWSFRKSPTSDLLAIYNKNAGKYIAAGKTRPVTWVFQPAYEWSWFPTVDKRIALFNAVREDYLVSDVYSAPFGQLNWHFHPVPVPPVPVVREATVAMDAQPPVQGYVPFLGAWGGGPGNQNVLIEVRNPQSHNIPLFFIKPGYSSSQCGQAGATIPLAPGAALTAEQMTTLWGSAEPSLGTRRAFLACAATSHSIVFVNIRYRGP